MTTPETKAESEVPETVDGLLRMVQCQKVDCVFDRTQLSKAKILLSDALVYLDGNTAMARKTRQRIQGFLAGRETP